MSGGSSRRYPPELRERAVRMVAEIRGRSSFGPSRRRCAPKICPYKYSIMLFGNQIQIFLSWCIIPTPPGSQ
ncbi:hypothetical protein [Mycobacterium tuberculosis]|uniref:hypothetical protein n=1 Tax=Mycobacterium tuberculosis TaxID=1773 RepID=UPI00045B25A0|nr:hypothetical protein [Mycobacterium tuberculosis]KCJ51950.1 hypothetical protein W027_00302 [Mycobacterium tuberculosis TB_RSA117]